MNLSKKTFIYSIILTGLVSLLAVIYLVFMLPSLYAENRIQEYRNQLIDTHEKYTNDGNYDNVSVYNYFNILSIKIPKNSYTINLCNSFANINIDIQDDFLRKQIDNLRTYGFEYFDNKDIADEISHKMKELADGFKNDLMNKFKVDVEFSNMTKNNDFFEKHAYSNKKYVKNKIFLVENVLEDNNSNIYLSSIAMSNDENGYTITFLSTIATDISAILPVITKSIPMILAVLIILSFVISMFFSSKIVGPIKKLSAYTQNARNTEGCDVLPYEVKGKDEISLLAVSINEFCKEQNANYNRLNNENIRKEVFLKSVSHQLKTPVASGLLLTEGMISKIGKYKDTDKYLPEVKEQFKILQKMIDDILSISKDEFDIEISKIDILHTVNQFIQGYDIQIKEKELNIDISGQGTINSDKKIFGKILDNIFNNAINYTDFKGKIEIVINDNYIEIENIPAHINDNIIDCVKDAFVSESNIKGKGLGLYIANYYAEMMNLRLDIVNTENGVKSVLFDERNYNK